MKRIRSLLVLFCAVASSGAAADDAPRTNVLYLVADDLGYADLGVQGAKDVPTPHLDSIARHGVRFTNGYVSAPVCSPSRAGLITGRAGTRFGHEFNHALADRSPDGVGLPLTEKTAAQWFKEAGYVTGHAGKWHLGNPNFPHYTPNARGFDDSFHFPGAKKLPPLSFNYNRKTGVAQDRYVDDAVAREAGGFITRHREQPWFLYVAFLTPHQPLETPPGTEEPFAQIAENERRKFAAMMTLLDGAVGTLLQALRESGQEERTLIVFHSDNGAPPKNGSRNTPLRGGKGTLWEGGVRAPFLLQWKGTLPAGRVIDAPVISLDLLPTALAAAQIAVPDGARFDGVNLLPFLKGETKDAPHAALFWRYGEQMAVRAGDWKLMRALDQTQRPPAVRLGLFNLKDDVSETRDLATTEPAKVRELQQLWDTWNAQNVPALWTSESSEDAVKPKARAQK